MSGLVVIFVVVMSVSSIVCWRIAKKRGYDVEIFTLGGFIGGPLAVHAALNAHKYAVEIDADEIQPLPALEEKDIDSQQKPDSAQDVVLAEPEIKPPTPISDLPDKPSVPLAQTNIQTNISTPPAVPVTQATSPVQLPQPDLITPPAGPEIKLPEPELTNSIPQPDTAPAPVLDQPPLPQTVPQPAIDPTSLAPQAPPLPSTSSRIIAPSLPGTPSNAPSVPASLAGQAPPIPMGAAPGIPNLTAEPPLPSEIPVPLVHEEQEDDQHKDESVPVVNSIEPEVIEVAPRTRSLIELISAEPTTTRRLGQEAFSEEEADHHKSKKGKSHAPTVVLGAPDENGVPSIAIAPGEATLGMCPHCGEDSYADWYGLCIECIQPFPVRVGYIDPTIKPDLVEASEGAPAAPSKKGKITLPKLKR